MVCSGAIFNYVTMADSGNSTPMSVWEENFGRKTEGTGAGSRSAWQFDLLWRILCCASVPQPHLKKIHLPPLDLTFTHCLRNFRPSQKIGSGLIFCVFTSVAFILIGKDEEYEENGKTHAKISDSVCNGLKKIEPHKTSMFKLSLPVFNKHEPADFRRMCLIASSNHTNYADDF